MAKAPVARSFAANLLRHPASLIGDLRMLASCSILEDARPGSRRRRCCCGATATGPSRHASRRSSLDRLPRRDPARHGPTPSTRWRRRGPRTPPAIIHDFISRRAGVSASQPAPRARASTSRAAAATANSRMGRNRAWPMPAAARRLAACGGIVDAQRIAHDAGERSADRDAGHLQGRDRGGRPVALVRPWRRP